MKVTVRPAARIRGAIEPPPDKSISHRAAIFNALAAGEARIENFLRGADPLATLRCLRALGVDWRWDGEDALVVRGRGPGGLQEPEDVLDCRNSGTTIRLLTGLLAAQPFISVLTGDASLRRRPMARVIEPLRLMGARINARRGDTLPPVVVRGGPLKGIDYRMPVASAQVKSAVILAGLFAEGETTVVQPAPSRDHTERMLAAMGADVQAGEGAAVSVRPLRGALNALSLRVPGDVSAAAPWLVLAAAHPDAELRLRNVGLNPTRTGIIDVLRRMGADIAVGEERREAGEPVADVTVRSSRLRGVEVSGALVPRAIDELPLVALAGCFAEGETVIRDAEELRVKESDRVAATALELRRLGAEVEELPDGLRVKGGRPLHGGRAAAHGDHRLAMLLGVAGVLAGAEVVIGGAEAVRVSYPWFWRDLALVCGQTTVKAPLDWMR